MNRKLVALFVVCIMIITGTGCKRTNNLNNEKNMENLNLTAEWDKTFPKSDKVIHSKVIFTNRYGITLAADMYVPKNITGKLPAIAVCGPFGAVKEQAAGLYAQTMAERGFLTVAFDPSYTGESGGEPRYIIRKTKCCTHEKRSAQKRKTKRIREIPLLIQSPRPENEAVATLF